MKVSIIAVFLLGIFSSISLKAQVESCKCNNRKCNLIGWNKAKCHKIEFNRDECCLDVIHKVKVGDRVCIQVNGFELSKYNIQITAIDTTTNIGQIPNMFGILKDGSNFKEKQDENKESTNVYKSLPIFINDAVKAIKLKISPYDASAKLPSYETNFFLNPTRKYYFGFSSGFIGSDVKNDNFSIRRNELSKDSSTYNIISEGSNKNEVGITSMVHAGYEIFQPVYAQLGIGPSMYFGSKLNLGLAIGAGLAIGRRNKITINGGVHWASVNRLSNSHDLTRLYLNSPESITVKKFERGGFISVGFNFLNF